MKLISVYTVSLDKVYINYTMKTHVMKIFRKENMILVRVPYKKEKAMKQNSPFVRVTQNRSVAYVLVHSSYLCRVCDVQV